MILGPSGDGKSTAIIVPPSGQFPLREDGLINMSTYLSAYEGLSSESTVIFNADGKELPFPVSKLGWEEGKNLFTSSYRRPLTADFIEKTLEKISGGSKIKSVVIDTINGSMNDKEMLETSKMTYDKWYDLAKDFYRLSVRANSMRSDLVIYLLGHVALITDATGNETRLLVTNGKKLEKIHLESKIPVVLHTSVEQGPDGDNKYVFETQKSRSSAKSPIGMFDKFSIPNSLALVDQKIREYYSI